MLAAMPQLASFIQTQMVEGLLNKEDDLLLNGPGGANNLLGIWTQATAYSPSPNSQAAGPNADLWNYFIDSIKQLSKLNYRPNGILVNPELYFEMFQQKTSGGEYNVPYAGVTITEGGVRIMGVPLIQTTTAALGETSFIVGDWRQATLLQREGLSFEISYEDADNFTKNLVTLRLEERIGLAVYHAPAFIKGTLPVQGA